MQRTRRLLPLALATVAVAHAGFAQELRRGVVDADLVVVARQVGKTAFSDEVDLHRLQVLDTLRSPGEAKATATVIDWPKLSLHARPSPRQGRIYCLHDATKEAQRIGLPSDGGPYYRMSSCTGANPLVGAELGRDPIYRFAQALVAGDRGVAPEATTTALATMALGLDPTVRIEATRHFAEQPLLRTRLTAVQWSQMLGRASAETDDIPYKIALVELCAEQRLDGVVDALVLGLDSVHDREYVRTAGRLCAALLGDGATQPLLQRLQTAGDRDTRAAIMLAIGATRTAPALDALLQLKQAGTADAAVDAALREHGSKRAQEAVLGGSKDKAPK